MKKLFYLISIALVVLLISVFYLRRTVIQQINTCIPQSNISAQKILIAGEVVKFEQDDDWLKFRINLCRRNIFNFQTINIVIPINARKEISVGQEVTIQNTQGYSWRKEKISNLGSLLQAGQLLVFRIEPFNSIEGILGEFDGIDINNCSLSAKCSLYLGYWNSYGDSQTGFVRWLNFREYSKILFSLFKNKITVFANGIGWLDSLEQFKNLSKSNLI